MSADGAANTICCALVAPSRSAAMPTSFACGTLAPRTKRPRGCPSSAISTPAPSCARDAAPKPFASTPTKTTARACAFSSTSCATSAVSAKNMLPTPTPPCSPISSKTSCRMCRKPTTTPPTPPIFPSSTVPACCNASSKTSSPSPKRSSPKSAQSRSPCGSPPSP